MHFPLKVKQSYMNLYSTLSSYITKALSYDKCVTRGSLMCLRTNRWPGWVDM